MKKLLALTLSGALILGAAACQKKPEPAPAEPEKPAEETVEETSEPVEETGGNMLTNGDFSNGTNDWFTFCQDGECEISVNGDGALDVDIKRVGTVEHGVQLYHDGFSLDEGCIYKITFNAYSDVSRPVMMRFQINGGDYHAYYEQPVNLSNSKADFEFEFTMGETSDPAPRFCFNMGVVDGVEQGMAEHHVYFDDFYLSLKDDSNKVAGSGTVEVSDISVNQIGYLPSAYKSATLRGPALNQTAKLINESTKKTVLEAKIGGGKDDPDTGDKEETFDFSSVKDEGTYHIEAGDVVSPSFKIGKNVYDEALKASVKMLYYQRCGTELDSSHAGDFAHGACHNDKAKLYENNSVTLDVSGGWHDAGDYGRYSVAGAVAAADLLLAYEDYPKVFGDDYGIPESKNKIPDVLDEARYELTWLLKMQRDDGGVYHKVTCKNFPGEVMPEEEREELFIMPVSTAATGDFAAVMAIAARVYSSVDKGFSDTCLAASKKAFDYLNRTPRDHKGYQNPSDVQTGQYEDSNDVDERFWAAAELFKTTGDKSYENALQSNLPETGYTLGWQGVGGYGAYAYLTAKGAGNTDNIKNSAKGTADGITGSANTYAYGSSLIGNYPWGSNLTIANNGEFILMMKKALGSSDKATADKQLNYILGNNSTGYCFMTGFGTVYTDHPHHRPSQAKGKTVPGMIAGGPNGGREDPYAQNVLKDTPIAKCYVDNSQSYSTNEVAIYWNSPVIYLLAGEIAAE